MAVGDNSIGETPEPLRVIILEGLELSRRQLGVKLHLIDAAGVKHSSNVGTCGATGDYVRGPDSSRGGRPVVAQIKQGPPQVAIERL